MLMLMMKYVEYNLFIVVQLKFKLTMKYILMNEVQIAYFLLDIYFCITNIFCMFCLFFLKFVYFSIYLLSLYLFV